MYILQIVKIKQFLPLLFMFSNHIKKIFKSNAFANYSYVNQISKKNVGSLLNCTKFLKT